MTLQYGLNYDFQRGNQEMTEVSGNIPVKYLSPYLSLIYQLSAICIYLGIDMQSGRVN